MRFALSIPQFVSDGEFDPVRFRAYMARAEALANLPILVGRQGLEPWTR